MIIRHDDDDFGRSTWRRMGQRILFRMLTVALCAPVLLVPIVLLPCVLGTDLDDKY